ncbi:helix-turn-helix domain-containing protein [Mycoplasmatota bacterium]|nr:helix-turn-helix domain-containing protein [Mycoplasmatota bacterium]
MDNQLIGKFLLKLRKEKGLTQKEIAKLCSVSTQAVSKWERGDSVPDIELLNRLSILYSITINEIIDGERKEIYVDVDKRTNIISLTSSILVFITYFFTFAKVPNEFFGGSTVDIVYKGFQLIFNGISGWQIYLTWGVFVLLVSHLILNIFILTHVVQKEKPIKQYFIITSMVIILISLFSIGHPSFTVFPQFIILTCVGIILFMNINRDEFQTRIDDYRTYNRQYKSSNIGEDLLLSDDKVNSKWMKITKISFLIAFIFYLLNVSALIVALFNELDNNVQNLDIGFLFLATIFEIIFIIFFFYSYRFIGSIYTSQILKIDALLIILLIPWMFFVGLGINIMILVFILLILAFNFFMAARRLA